MTSAQKSTGAKDDSSKLVVVEKQKISRPLLQIANMYPSRRQREFLFGK